MKTKSKYSFELVVQTDRIDLEKLLWKNFLIMYNAPTKEEN